MANFFLFIFSFSFVLQTVAASFYPKNKEVRTEQCPDANKSGEDSSNPADNKDYDQVYFMSNFDLQFLTDTEIIPDKEFHIVSGYMHKILLPPRELNLFSSVQTIQFLVT